MTAFLDIQIIKKDPTFITYLPKLVSILLIGAFLLFALLYVFSIMRLD